MPPPKYAPDPEIKLQHFCTVKLYMLVNILRAYLQF